MTKPTRTATPKIAQTTMIAASLSGESPDVALAETIDDSGGFVLALDVVSEGTDVTIVPADCIDVTVIVDVAAALVAAGEDSEVVEAARRK